MEGVALDDVMDEMLETEDPVEELDNDNEADEVVDPIPEGWAAANGRTSSPESFDEAIEGEQLDESRDETLGDSLHESLLEQKLEEAADETYSNKPKPSRAKRPAAARPRKTSGRANSPAKRARKSASNDKVPHCFV